MTKEIVVINPESEDRTILLLEETEWRFTVPDWFDKETATAYVNMMTQYPDWGLDDAMEAEEEFIRERQPTQASKEETE